MSQYSKIYKTTFGSTLSKENVSDSNALVNHSRVSINTLNKGPLINTNVNNNVSTKTKDVCHQKLKVFLEKAKSNGETMQTHTAFGGKCQSVCSPFSIPKDQQNLFHKLYTEAYGLGCLLTLVEMKTHGKWIFYIDLDSKTQMNVDISNFIPSLNLYLPKLFSEAFGPGNYAFEFQPKSNDPNRIHVYCTSHKIVVNGANAAALRSQIIHFIHHDANISPDILDELVDKNMCCAQGFRMYGSRKGNDDGDYVQYHTQLNEESLNKYSIQVDEDATITPLLQEFSSSISMFDVSKNPDSDITVNHSSKAKKPKPKETMQKVLAPQKEGKQNAVLNNDNNDDDPILPMLAKKRTTNDNFDDVVKALDAHGWKAQASSIKKATQGSRWITVHLSNKNTAKPYICPRTNTVHAHNNGKISFDRSLGLMTLKCLDPSCDEFDFPWPTQPMDTHSLSSSPLFMQIQKYGLSNHCDIAAMIAPLARESVAFDVQHLEWRIFDKRRGTWACATPTAAGQTLRQILVLEIQALVDKSIAKSKTLPSGSARSEANNIQPLLEKAIAKSGGKSFINDFRPQFESILSVNKEQWESHFCGYFPVANVLLHFDIANGAVHPLPYTPNMFVRQEYQADMTWLSDDVNSNHFQNTNTNDSDAKLLDRFFSGLWTDDERKSWLEFIAYGMSRTAFAEKFWVIEGRPASAKSTVIKMLINWLGEANVLARTPVLLVMKKEKGTIKKDDDGTGHDSAMIACYDKAFVILKEPGPNSYWRQGKLKDMTGDDQSGRAAHSPHTVGCKRSFVIAMVGNHVPKPEDASDGALVRRNEWITTTNVFITDERHKQAVMKLMSPKDIKTSNFVMADQSIVTTVLQNASCKSYFLSLIAHAWNRLIIAQKKTFFCSPTASKRLRSYWTSVAEDQDSCVSFFSQCISVNSNTLSPKTEIFAAYQMWFQQEKNTNGLGGDPVKDLTFFRRLKEHFQHAHAVSEARPSMPVAESTGILSDEPNWGVQPYKMHRLHCYTGLYIKDMVAQFAANSIDDVQSPPNTNSALTKHNDSLDSVTVLSSHPHPTPLKLSIKDAWNAYIQWKSKPLPFNTSKDAHSNASRVTGESGDSGELEFQSTLELAEWTSFPIRLLSIFPHAAPQFDKQRNTITHINGITLKV
jgi:hypothetical protein